MNTETNLIPAGPLMARQWILEAMKDGPHKRSEIFADATKIANKNGCSIENAEILKKAIESLERDHSIVKVQFGWYDLPESEWCKKFLPLQQGEIR